MFNRRWQVNLSLQVGPDLSIAHASYRWHRLTQVAPIEQGFHFRHQAVFDHSVIARCNTLMQHCPVGRLKADGDVVPRFFLVRALFCYQLRHGFAGNAVNLQGTLDSLAVVGSQTLRGQGVNML